LNVDILITDKFEASELLDSRERRSAFGYLVSIGDVGEEAPGGIHHVRDHLRLSFSDTIDDSGASERDVRTLIDLARRVADAPGGVLLHCHAGISRSTAAAFILVAVLLGAGRESEALDHVFRARPVASPNLRMIEIADRLLRRNGAMLQAIRGRESHTQTSELADRGRGTRRRSRASLYFL
jgi:predicted protein tyrosine phosphatase